MALVTFRGRRAGALGKCYTHHLEIDSENPKVLVSAIYAKGYEWVSDIIVSKKDGTGFRLNLEGEVIT